jgi:hypothetical protein
MLAIIKLQINEKPVKHFPHWFGLVGFQPYLLKNNQQVDLIPLFKMEKKL